jgi:RNA polymerase sigma-32 factor
MKAVRHYDPSKGFRLSTYALWWIRATINEFILSSWSIVRIGTQAAQKKLFFGLRKLKARLGIYHDGDMTHDEVKKIASSLDVPESDVVEMNGRIQRDSSLNRPAGADDDEEKVAKLASSAPNSEEIVAEGEVNYMRMKMLFSAIDKLPERERIVIKRRRLTESPDTLEKLANELGVSKERVRQIEGRAMEKLTAYLTKHRKEYEGS